MSLILEALRRSEAERHQESLPDSLAKQQALLYAANKRAFYWPVLICLLLLVNLMVLGYFVYQATAVPRGDSSESPGLAMADTAMAASVQNLSEQLSIQAQEKERVSPESTVGEVDLGTARATLASRPLPPPRRVVVHSSQVGLNTDREEASNYISANESYINLQDESYIDRQNESHIDRQNESHIDRQNESYINLQNEKDTEVKVSSVTPQANRLIPHINELDKSFLATLPKLVFNSHIYSKESSGSRIMINDNYLREGEGFLGIKVITITEDGVVLEKQARQFQVPVVRDWSPGG